jgi:hypothetical protein
MGVTGQPAPRLKITMPRSWRCPMAALVVLVVIGEDAEQADGSAEAGQGVACRGTSVHQHGQQSLYHRDHWLGSDRVLR